MLKGHIMAESISVKASLTEHADIKKSILSTMLRMKEEDVRGVRVD
jgi:hypothetical protein